MNITALLFVIIIGYIIYDLYKSKEKIFRKERMNEIKEEILNSKISAWIIGFIGMILIMFLIRGIVIVEYEAQTCNVVQTGDIRLMKDTLYKDRYSNVFGIDGNNSFVVGDKGIDYKMNDTFIASSSKLLIQNKSWNYYRRIIISDFEGIKPTGLNITCNYDFRGTWNRIKNDVESAK